MPENSVDSIVTDPPYELGFMGRSWDATGITFNVEVWAEALRVLKPGGHLLAFSSSRTYHRMTVAVEDAGFEIRDQIQWVYGSGFPKSMDIGKKLEDWKGWGTALKPAHEPIVLARKPMTTTIAVNVEKYGTGGINIDASRVEDGNRWPANLMHDGSSEVTEFFGAPHRFFYSTKTTQRDRNEGLDNFEAVRVHDGRELGKPGGSNPRNRSNDLKLNPHPTVKPTELMRYLCRLLTPPKGVILDPFMGSGSTGKGAVLEGFDFIGIEINPEYVEIAKARIDFALVAREQDALFPPGFGRNL